MLKVTIFALCLVAAWAIPAEHHDVVPIVSQESDVEADGHYHFSYESGDGSKVSQNGELKGEKDHQGEAVVGSFEYKGEDGHVYHVDYTADAEHGYVPHGEHIPQIPETIARALKWSEEHPYKEEEHSKH